MVDGGVEHDVGLLGKERLGVAHYGDKRVAEIFEQWHEYFYFGGVAAFGDADYHVGGLHHSEVAMYGVGGVHEQCRSASGIERADDFGGDVGALANACHNHAPLGVKNGLNSFDKSIVYIGSQMFNSFFFVLNNLSSNMFDFVWGFQWK